MAILEIKKGNKKEELKPISFKKEDFLAVKGTEKSFFKGEVKIVHVELAKKLILEKKAIEAKGVEFEKKENDHRSSKDRPKN